MKLIILTALLAQTFAVEPQVVVPNVDKPQAQGVPPHIQLMAEQHISHILQHVPQVREHIHQLNQQHQRNVVPNVQVPNVPGVPQHVQEFAKQHMKHVLQHIPHAQKHIRDNVKGEPIPDLPNNPIRVVSHQVRAAQPSDAFKKVGLPVALMPNDVPPHVQQVVQLAHQHIPQVLKAHLNQQRAPKAVHMPSIDDSRCPYQCPIPDRRVCATNGKCWIEFDSQCEMNKNNCLNPERRAFHTVEDAQCMDAAKPKCYPGDM